MIRSVLLGVDSTPGSIAAQAVAFDLTQRLDLRLTGIDVLDSGRIVTREPVPIGALGFKAQGEAERLKHAVLRWDRERTRILAEAVASGLTCHVIMATGDTAVLIAQAAPSSDLLVLGRDASFGVADESDLPTFLGTLLRKTPRPICLVPAHGTPPRHMLIAYDGSVPAARALQMFALLGLAKLGDVSVASVSAEQGRADATANGAIDYLAMHGIAARPHAISSDADPADVLADIARDQGADMIVMGAYGHRGWREMLLGSCTTRLLQRCPVSLLVHH
jgi:nucleotide-binding universal stress UspA family protein